MTKRPPPIQPGKPAARLAQDVDLRLEQAILQAKQEWERTFDSVPDCILILDEMFCARRLNMSLGERLGAHPRDILGQTLEELTGLDGQGAAHLRRMCSEAACSAEEMEIPRWGGHYLLAVSPYLNADGTRNGTIVVAHDVTHRKLLEQQLEQSRKLEALGTLAGGIAHDFNNILGVILGYAEMMQSQAIGGPQEHRIQEILRAGSRARELIGQILTFSRQGEGRTVPLRLTPLVKEVLRHLLVTMPAGINVRRRFESEADEVLADPSMIHQVVLNLCTNAVQAMRDSGGTLELGVDTVFVGAEGAPELADLSSGTYVRLRVRDSGPGIPEDIAGRIFDPFFTTKRPGEGTGMGLAVAHGIVRRHGGTITVESRPGQGATLSVYLRQKLQADAADLAAGTPLPGGHAAVLLVDDEPALLAVTAESLTGLGYRVTAVSGGEEALAHFAANPAGFDLLLTDQVMPQLSGVELAKGVLALRPDLPVVLCTGHSGAEVLAEAKRLGVRQVLDKPVPMRQMAETLHRVLAATPPRAKRGKR